MDESQEGIGTTTFYKEIKQTRNILNVNVNFGNFIMFIKLIVAKKYCFVLVKKLNTKFNTRIRTDFRFLKTHFLNLLAFMECSRKEQAAHGVTPATKKRLFLKK